MSDATLSFTIKNGSAPFTIPGSLNRKTVLYFMRAANCAQCNRHTRELEKLGSELQKHDLDVIVIVPEDAMTAEKVKTRNRLTIRVMAGEGAAHALAGLDKKALGLIQQSGTVVVDQDGQVLYQRIATNPENSFNGKEFQSFLEPL